MSKLPIGRWIDKNMKQPIQTPIEELRQKALEQYREAVKDGIYNSFIANAIKSYNPRTINAINADEFEKMLDKRICELEKKLEGRMPPSARRINSGKLTELKTIRAMTHLYYGVEK